MSDAAKQVILEAAGNASGKLDRAQAITVAYAGSANASPDRIPKLFADLVELFTVGEAPKNPTRVQG